TATAAATKTRPGMWTSSPAANAATKIATPAGPASRSVARRRAGSSQASAPARRAAAATAASPPAANRSRRRGLLSVRPGHAVAGEAERAERAVPVGEGDRREPGARVVERLARRERGRAVDVRARGEPVVAVEPGLVGLAIGGEGVERAGFAAGVALDRPVLG